MFCSVKCVKKSGFVLWNVSRSLLYYVKCVKSSFVQWNVLNLSHRLLTLDLVDMVLSHHNLSFFNLGSLLPSWKLEPPLPHPTNPPIPSLFSMVFNCTSLFFHCLRSVTVFFVSDITHFIVFFFFFKSPKCKQNSINAQLKLLPFSFRQQLN